jgi:heme/copper-type cytochrome/quinol oxidase subunit 3
VPLLNTLILLLSGATVTWAHHAIVGANHSQAVLGLVLTVILGIIFTGLQGMEYLEAGFTISDCVYGSCFYIATGFHVFHVLVGTTFLLACLIRQMRFHFTASHHFGFEAAAWY